MRTATAARRTLGRVKALWWWKVRIGIVEWIKTHPLNARHDHPIDLDQHINTFFDPELLDRIPETVRQVRHFDPWLRAHLELAGRLRAWEYGLFLKAFPDLAGMKLLDAGIGGSTFSAYCASRGADVVGLDLPVPFEQEPTSTRLLRRRGVKLLHGSVTDVPVADGTFDIVLCVSVLEHLGEDPAGTQAATAAERLHLFTKAIEEISRVLKPSGRAYLTLEVCDRNRQATDRWAGSTRAGEVRGAYDLDFVYAPMRQAIQRSGLRLQTETNLDPQILYRQHSRQNYRGRYISTLCVIARKQVDDGSVRRHA